MSCRASSFLTLVLVLAWAPPAPAQQLQIFPTYAVLTETGGLRIPVAGQVVDPTRHGPLRGMFLRHLGRKLSIDEGTAAWKALDARTALFMARGATAKNLQVAGGGVLMFLETGGGGRFEGEFGAPPAFMAEEGTWLRLTLSADVPEGRDERAVPVIGPEGLSVVSDVDDTVKVTEVLDEGRKLANTFIHPYRAVPGMAERYREWAGRGGVAFHYVSGSPWPLLTPLEDFLTEAGFPAGSLHLLRFSVRPGFLDVLMGNPTKDHKLDTIERLMADFPRRRFFLVGDSTEFDPEVYGEIARRHPGQVVGIRIRDVEPRPLDAERAGRAFQGVPAGLWSTFVDPAALDAEPGRR